MVDTDTAIYTIKNRPPEVRAAFNRHADQLAISTVTVGELIYGARRSQQVERNLIEIEGFVARLAVLGFDSEAAAHFGRIRAELVGLGTAIGPYDLMIAGHARSRGLVVVTNNLREFERVAGLRAVSWVSS